MSGRAVVAVGVAVLLAVPAVAADKAQSRSGSSSGRSSSSSSSKSGSTSSKSSSGSSSTKSSSSRSSSTKSSSARSSSTKSGGSRAAQVPTTGAQRRHPRPGTGRGQLGVPYGTDFYSNGYSVKNLGAYPYSYYSPYARPGYGYGFGYGPYRNGYGYGYGYGSGYGSSGYPPFGTSPYPGYSGVSEIEEPEEEDEAEEEDEMPSAGVGTLRILVQPEKARVFVDGYYVGLVDDFDGILQRLTVPAGRHEISLRLDGYRTQNFTVDVPEDGTLKVEHKMVRGSSQTAMETYTGRPVGHARMESGEGTLGTAPPAAPVADTGMLRLGVRPHDASIYVDGAFRGTGSTVSALRLAPGRHRLEVVKPGHVTVERDVDVEAGETVEIEVELDRN